MYIILYIYYICYIYYILYIYFYHLTHTYIHTYNSSWILLQLNLECSMLMQTKYVTNYGKVMTNYLLP